MNNKRLLLLIDYVLDKVTELKLSEIFPKVLTLAKQTDDKEFEKWILLETTGYFEINPALTDDVKVPAYRRVPGQYADKYGNPLIIDQPELISINNYPFREGVSELEELITREGNLSFRNPVANNLLKKNFGIEVDTFNYSPKSLISILVEIKNQLINKLVEKQKEITQNLREYEIDPNVPVELSGLHPIVQKTAGELYKNGHYRQAILDTYISLVDAVKMKSGRHDLDNTPLMQSVFSPKNPLLEISENGDEQLGFMWLFSGAVMGIRNPKAHRLVQQNDPQRALEWLSFASVLLRVLDDSKLEK